MWPHITLMGWAPATSGVWDDRGKKKIPSTWPLRLMRGWIFRVKRDQESNQQTYEAAVLNFFRRCKNLIIVRVCSPQNNYPGDCF